jgi:electron transport complex protein RnfE
MGLTTTSVLILYNLLISMMRKIIPNGVRMPAYIVIVATLVTIAQMMLEAFVPSLYSSLGIYIPLIVVNCIILGRAESYASKNKPLPSAFDGLGMGLGFTVGLTSIGIVRELLGSGTLFNMSVMPSSYEPVSIMILAPGAFFVLAGLTALQNKLKAPSATNVMGIKISCGGDCAHCMGEKCATNHMELKQADEEEKARRLQEIKEKAAANEGGHK